MLRIQCFTGSSFLYIVKEVGGTEYSFVSLDGKRRYLLWRQIVRIGVSTSSKAAAHSIILVILLSLDLFILFVVLICS